MNDLIFLTRSLEPINGLPIFQFDDFGQADQVSLHSFRLILKLDFQRLVFGYLGHFDQRSAQFAQRGKTSRGKTPVSRMRTRSLIAQ